jgi:hypothetical protein
MDSRPDSAKGRLVTGFLKKGYPLLSKTAVDNAYGRKFYGRR